MADKKGVNPVVAGVAGAAIGAAVAGAAIALSDKGNREKLGKVAKELKEEGTKALKEVQKEAKKVQQIVSTKNGSKTSAPKTKAASKKA